jgi:NTP pyrophosphatase (non-canonical NTP hydrolase)
MEGEGEIMPDEVQVAKECESISDKICRAAIKKFGKDAQMDMVVEEASELIKTIVKYRRYNGNPVWRLKAIEEAADVSIMVRQLVMMLSSDDEFSRVLDNKLKNLEAIILNDDPERGMIKKEK